LVVKFNSLELLCGKGRNDSFVVRVRVYGFFIALWSSCQCGDLLLCMTCNVIMIPCEGYFENEKESLP